MATKNSEPALMVRLTISLLIDIADDLAGYEYKRDAREVRRRTTSEGVSFLTKVLPKLGKALDRALSSDKPMDYTGFKTREGYPEFLGDLFQRVFDQSGRVHSDVLPQVIGYIRQVLYLWYKYELPYTPIQKAALESSFIHTEATLPDEVPSSCPVIQGARDLIARVVKDFSHSAITPKHGPGAVATREQAWEKWRFKRLYQPIERLFPFTEWYIPTLSYLSEFEWTPKGKSTLEPLGHLEVRHEGTARAVFVPKDSRGPRLISCEPLEYQWIQQGVAAELIYCINKSEITSGRVNFTSQEVNRWYALAGSIGAGWVTLDMKDASDRVTNNLVLTLFGKSHVGEYLQACRSHNTVLPSGRQVALKKFAPMGSALCFPVESLVFFALAVNVLVHHVGVPLDKALERVKVYGDDLICGSDDYAAIMQYFPYVGLMFNEAKCCTGGSFRESCGLDAYSGVDVTPVKIRTRLNVLHDAAAFVSGVEYSNALDYRGYWHTAQVLRQALKENPLESEVPYRGHDDGPTSAIVYRTWNPKAENLRDNCSRRWNHKFQRSEFRGVSVRTLAVKRNMPGWERLFANIADNLPRSSKPKRNQHFYSWPSEYYPTRAASTRGFVDSDDVSQGLKLRDGDSREGLKTVMFPLRRRVTLTRRWQAE